MDLFILMQEIIQISESQLIVRLDTNIKEWRAHPHISREYWEMFIDKYPVLGDTLPTNFQARSITGTVGKAFSSFALCNKPTVWSWHGRGLGRRTGW